MPTIVSPSLIANGTLIVVSVGAGFGVTVTELLPLTAGAPGVKSCTPMLLLSRLFAVGATGATVALEATIATAGVAVFCGELSVESQPTIRISPAPMTIRLARWHKVDLFMNGLSLHGPQ